MPFTQDTFAPVAPNSTAAPGFWSYTTPDSFATVLTPGYFSQKKFQLRVHDFIWVITSDERRVIRYAGEIDPPEIIAPKPPINVFTAFSIVNQEPVALDTPIQIEFGAAQGTGADPIQIDALGNLTFNEAGVFDVNFTMDVGRMGSSGGVANIFLRALINGGQFGNPLATLVNDPSTIVPEQFEVTGIAAAGDVVTFEIYRDSAGVNEGGIFAQTSSIGWGTAASAILRVSRFI